MKKTATWIACISLLSGFSGAAAGAESPLPSGFRIEKLDFTQSGKTIQQDGQSYQQLTLSVPTVDGKTLTVHLDRVVANAQNRGFGVRIDVLRDTTLACDLEWADASRIGNVMTFATPNGMTALFFTGDLPTHRGGSIMLYAFSPEQCLLISAITGGGGRHPLDRFMNWKPEKNYGVPGMDDERRFLEAIRYQYGYEDEKTITSKDDLWSAVRFWAVQNGRLVDDKVVLPDHGKLKIRRYRTPFHFEDLKDMDPAGADDRFVYRLYNHSDVVAQDKSTHEWFVLFVPPDGLQLVSVTPAAEKFQLECAGDTPAGGRVREYFDIDLKSFEYQGRRSVTPGEEPSPVEQSTSTLEPHIEFRLDHP